MRISHLLVAAAIALQLLAPNLRAQQDLTREQALDALTHESAAARVAGAERLGQIGSNEDVPALLRVLHHEHDDTRSAAERSLWRIWSRSGDAATDRLFMLGVEQMNERNLPRALATLTEVIHNKPDFAEGWNRRATLYFMMGEYLKSLRDCEEVIKRNPNHFGVLAGYGQIYLELNQPEKALEYFQRAININPNMLMIINTMDKIERIIQRKREGLI